MLRVYDQWGIADGYYGVDRRWHYTPSVTRDLLRETIGDPPSTPPLLFVDSTSGPHQLLSRHRLLLEGDIDAGEMETLPPNLPTGYHRLEPVDEGPPTRLIVAPPKCPKAVRGWGVAVQIPSLWHPDGWGVGDLADVGRLAGELVERGGSALLMSPLHAPTLAAPHDPSPYFPSSRRWLNPMLIPMVEGSPLKNLRGEEIDRNHVWPPRRRQLLARFRRLAPNAPWRAWAAEQGDDLRLFCLWTALAERLGPKWRQWPSNFRHPQSPSIRDLYETDSSLADMCNFHSWLQWLARRTLDGVAAASPVALIADLAVGSSPDGADTWRYQDSIALDVHVGAPPDEFNSAGQDWGVSPMIPARLRSAHYQPFIAMLRATLQGMGGIRIDHVMGLFRQFWVPVGGEPADGTYVQSPAEELLAIVRLEAERAKAFVIGEDLGNVEEQVRDSLHSSGILGTKVWWFDPHPDEWREDCLAMATTHDLPTIAGVWRHTDGTPDMATMLQSVAPQSDLATTAAKLHADLAASDATLCIATLEDLAGADERPNHPGTTNEQHPNWNRRMSATTAEILSSEPGRSIVAAIANARPTIDDA